MANFTGRTDANGDEWPEGIEPQHYLTSPLSHLLESAVWASDATTRLRRAIADLTAVPMERR